MACAIHYQRSSIHGLFCTSSGRSGSVILRTKGPTWARLIGKVCAWPALAWVAQSARYQSRRTRNPNVLERGARKHRRTFKVPIWTHQARYDQNRANLVTTDKNWPKQIVHCCRTSLVPTATLTRAGSTRGTFIKTTWIRAAFVPDTLSAGTH